MESLAPNQSLVEMDMSSVPLISGPAALSNHQGGLISLASKTLFFYVYDRTQRLVGLILPYKYVPLMLMMPNQQLLARPPHQLQQLQGQLLYQGQQLQDQSLSQVQQLKEQSLSQVQQLQEQPLSQVQQLQGQQLPQVQQLQE